PTILFSVGTRHCRLLYIIVPCPYNIIFGRDTALPSPLYYSGATEIEMNPNFQAKTTVRLP
ncbi:hypothetical protein, partial [Tychonema sp. BBK16]|uniref:hypothetical protein n=1 Tax=Tychonema sp. BBK16 TaxID=2699888 RepID=UPI001F4420DE